MNSHELTKYLEILTSAIMTPFESPDKWPMTDKERVELLRELYQTAKSLRGIVRGKSISGGVE
jgi:hypothetical protein